MRRLIRFTAVLLIPIVIAVGVSQAFQASRTAQQAQRASQVIDEFIVEEGSLRVTVSATGAILPEEQIALAFQVPGIVAEVMVEEGDAVRAGDPLARLDSTELETALANVTAALELQRIAYQALTAPPREVDLAVAQAAFDAARAQVAAAASTGVTPQQREIARLQAELARNQLWQAQLQRDLALAPRPPLFVPDISQFIPDGVDIPQEIIDQANAALAGLLPSLNPSPGVSARDLNAGLAQAEFGVQIADSNAQAVASRGADAASIASANAAVTAAQVALDRLVSGASDLDRQMAEIGLLQAQLAVEQARLALDRAVLTAPFDGVVAQLNLRAGEPTPTNQPAVLLVDDSAYYVDLTVDETDVVRVEVGQPVEFRFDALPDAEITGQVVRISAAPTVIGQLVTYQVRVRLDPTDQPVRIAMSATATIVVDEREEVLTIPNRFIRIDRNTGEAFVTVEREPGRFVEVPVRLGVRSETTSEVISGIEPGQRVVLLPRDAFDIFSGPPPTR
jgi:HlyD family secretion protein